MGVRVGIMGTIAVQYCFRLSDKRREVFDLELDEERLVLVGHVPENLPDWTKLEFHQCPDCTLDMGTHPRCPAASHLANVVTRFADIFSYDDVHVDVSTQERHISQDTTANAVIALDLFTEAVLFVIEESLEEIGYLFAPYLNGL